MNKRKKVINEILERHRLTQGYDYYVFAATAIEAITTYLIREKASFSIDADYENNTGICTCTFGHKEIITFHYIYNT